MSGDDAQRRTSLVVPILLITLGTLFLFRNWHPGFEIGHVLGTYWPLILIAVGLGKIWDSSRNRTAVGQASSGVALGSTIGVVVAVLIVVALLGYYQKSRHRFYGGSDDTNDSSNHASHTEEVVELQGAKSVRAELKMGAGEMNIKGGSGHLLNSRFYFNRKWDGPRVNYHVSGDKGELEITQDQGTGMPFTASNNTWDLTFNNDVPLELRLELAAGRSELKLREMNVTGVEVSMAAGQVEMDLTGPRRSDLSVKVNGAVGQATIRLPRDVGVIAHATGICCAIDFAGLKKEGNDYINQAYGKTPHTIKLNVEGALGNIEFVEE